MIYFLYRRALPDPARSPLPDPPADCRIRLWRPTWRRPLARGLAGMPFLAWSLFHGLGVFRTRDYALLLIHRDGRLVHRTCLLPAHFRFPFMAPGDLQAAGIWTDPGQRGQGLATLAMAHLLAHLGGPARTLWYLTRLDNLESIHLAEKCGYLLAGRVVRQPRWGSRLLATFRLETTGEP